MVGVKVVGVNCKGGGSKSGGCKERSTFNLTPNSLQLKSKLRPIQLDIICRY